MPKTAESAPIDSRAGDAFDKYKGSPGVTFLHAKMFIEQFLDPFVDLFAYPAGDFLRMARREEDPDTLFFSRRLSMEGDTELGLVVKNSLDALELPPFDPKQWAPRRVLSALASVVPPLQRPGVGPRHPRHDE